MIENAPPSPQGSSAFHVWSRWAQQSLLKLRTQEQSGASTNRTSRGTYVLRPNRRPPLHSMEGQVIAKHKFVGCPPFTASQRRGSAEAPVTDDYGVDEITGLAYGSADPWINSIADFFGTTNAQWTGQPDVDAGDVSERYRTVTLKANGYEHIITTGVHEESGIGYVPFPGASGCGVIYESLTSYRNNPYGAGVIEAEYDFGIGDDGVFTESNDAPYSDTYMFGIVEAASWNVLPHPPASWPPAGHVSGGTRRSAYVTGTCMSLHVTTYATYPGGTESALSYEYSFTLSNPWSFAEFQLELDRMLKQVDLSSPRKRYPIEGDTTRAIDPAGEQIEVTRKGPYNDGTTAYPVRYVFTSTTKPWNWNIAGPCRLAQNLDDITDAALVALGEGGVDSATDEPSVLSLYGSGYWTKMKSMVALPPGSFTKEILRYQEPTPDGAAFAWPFNASNSTYGGELLSTVDSAVPGGGKKRSFAPGDWITITKVQAD